MILPPEFLLLTVKQQVTCFIIAIITMACVVAAMVFFGVSRAVVEPPKPSPKFERHGGFPDAVKVLRDPFNGCQYLVIHGQSVTPRLGGDGQPMCGPKPDHLP